MDDKYAEFQENMFLDSLYSVKTAAAMVGVTVRTIYNTICTRKSEFDAPRYIYQRGRRKRMLSARDVRNLRRIIVRHVK